MAEPCPRCGFAEVTGEACPQCGVGVALFRASLERLRRGPAAPPPAAAPVEAAS